MCSHAVGNSSVERNQEDTCEKWENHCGRFSKNRKGCMGTDICQEEGLSFPCNREKGDYGNRWGYIGGFVDIVLMRLHDQ